MVYTNVELKCSLATEITRTFVDQKLFLHRKARSLYSLPSIATSTRELGSLLDAIAESE